VLGGPSEYPEFLRQLRMIRKRVKPKIGIPVVRRDSTPVAGLLSHFHGAKGPSTRLAPLAATICSRLEAINQRGVFALLPGSAPERRIQCHGMQKVECREKLKAEVGTGGEAEKLRPASGFCLRPTSARRVGPARKPDPSSVAGVRRVETRKGGRELIVGELMGGRGNAEMLKGDRGKQKTESRKQKLPDKR
jgi:hypothetical protein